MRLNRGLNVQLSLITTDVTEGESSIFFPTLLVEQLVQDSPHDPL